MLRVLNLTRWQRVQNLVYLFLPVIFVIIGSFLFPLWLWVTTIVIASCFYTLCLAVLVISCGLHIAVTNPEARAEMMKTLFEYRDGLDKTKRGPEVTVEITPG